VGVRRQRPQGPQHLLLRVHVRRNAGWIGVENGHGDLGGKTLRIASTVGTGEQVVSSEPLRVGTVNATVPTPFKRISIQWS